MTQVKFRGFRTDGKGWIEGDLLQVQTLSPRIIPFNHWHLQDFMGETEKYTVHPSSVGQFTGLLDKNGKEIYDGDIISILIRSKNEDDFGFYDAKIYFDSAAFWFKTIKKKNEISIVDCCWFHYNAKDRTVIGNTFDQLQTAIDTYIWTVGNEPRENWPTWILAVSNSLAAKEWIGCDFPEYAKGVYECLKSK